MSFVVAQDVAIGESMKQPDFVSVH
jgi:hypothetical protein